MTNDLRSISLLLLLFISAQTALRAGNCPPWMSPEECDLCGCTTSGGNFGFGTLGNADFVGIRYIYQKFKSRDGIFDNSPSSIEKFNTYQLWTKFPVFSNLYVTGTVPYQDLYREFEDRTEHSKGLGDISIMSWYSFRFYKNRTASENVPVQVESRMFTGHSLDLGIGIKLPTGSFEDILTDRVNPGFQVGTGGTDGIFSLGYGYNKGMFGIHASGSYYLKGENKNRYKFGDQFSYNLNVYQGLPINKSVIRPFVGLGGDRYKKIEQYGDPLPDTEGKIFIGSFGAEYSFDSFILGANYGIPLGQDLYGGNVEMKNRLLLYFNFTM